MKYFNINLFTLKCVIFVFFGALGCLYPFLPLHMTTKGLDESEREIVSIVSPCVALLGPAIAGPLADKLAGGSKGSPRSKNGKYLRVMLALCFIFAIILYWLLTAVPTIGPCEISSIDSSQCTSNGSPTSNDKSETIREDGESAIKVVCDRNGGEIRVSQCIPGRPCAGWQDNAIASFYVRNCNFTCATGLQLNFTTTTKAPESDVSVSSDYVDDYQEFFPLTDTSPIEANIIKKPGDHIPNPHLCFRNGTESHCNVYSMNEDFWTGTEYIKLQVPIYRHTDVGDAGVCRYPIGDDFYCRLGAKMIGNNTIDLSESCSPIIKCDVYNPLKKDSSSILIESGCVVNSNSFWWYLVIRCIADIFPAAAVALLDAAIIIATRETSTGRGDAGKQFAAGAFALALFPLIVGTIDSEIAAFILFTVLLVIGALILLFDNNMPLSPPEWWWHTRCGLLALPLSSIRKYSLETAALGLVLLLLGIFWNGIDTYIPWHIYDYMDGTRLNIGLTITVGALPAVVLFLFIEKIVDYCGHTNLLITAFTFYIIHYAALSVTQCPWLLLPSEALEIFTLHIMWVTAVFYLRHLIPRRYTVTGQALPVIAHFCLGRFIGALLGGCAHPWTKRSAKEVYEWFAVAAANIAVFYFVVYHFYLKPKCAAPISEAERPAPALIQNVNGNGNYTPLRVYHNGKAKKGQFKY